MIVFYLLFGAVIFLSYDLTPSEPLQDLDEAEPHRPRSRRDLLFAVTVWCIVLPLWPLAVAHRAIRTMRNHRADQHNV